MVSCLPARNFVAAVSFPDHDKSFLSMLIGYYGAHLTLIDKKKNETGSRKSHHANTSKSIQFSGNGSTALQEAEADAASVG
jgi:hypothetical protein